MKNARTGNRKAKKLNSERKRFVLLHWHKVVFCLMAYDIAAMAGAYLFALWLRFDCNYSEIPAQTLSSWLHFTPVYVLFGILVFWVSSLIPLNASPI